ncbi:unnamed protein product [Eruca vesicaria subsp. sativa]|uniref:Uncharacterized protein n=1 Tax=Eruca vesicaria subsp. sativa TaxID=29727 RepID=A0ABC8J9V7_ERUVS|nr:unnamed protein product [Eruca vesicaria subsp. sativa]
MELVSDLAGFRGTHKELFRGCKKVAKVQFLKMVLHLIQLSVSSMAKTDLSHFLDIQVLEMSSRPDFSASQSLAGKVATISLSAFGPGGPFRFGLF